MIRTIDNQMMLNQTLEASKTVGNHINTQEHNKAHQAEREQERLVKERQNVVETKAAEHRRIQEDENRKKKENNKRSPSKIFTESEENIQGNENEPIKINTWNMGRSIDIDV